MTDPHITEHQDTVAIPGTEVRVPKHLELPVKIDTEGKVWPVGGLTRMARIPLAHLLDAGVEVQWRMPDGSLVDQVTGTLLVKARQLDMDRGYSPTFDDPAITPDHPGPEAAQP